MPIVVHPIPIYASGIEFRPFVAGTQTIDESGEKDKKTVGVGGPFKFQPLYPTYVESPLFVPSKVEDDEETIEVSVPVPNGKHSE